MACKPEELRNLIISETQLSDEGRWNGGSGPCQPWTRCEYVPVSSPLLDHG
jgi:hypothetical protein